MILSGNEISRLEKDGTIHIFPFNQSHVTTNSYDLTLGNKFYRYKNEIIDPRVNNEVDEIIVGEDGINLKKGDFLLAHSQEVIGSNAYVPIIHAKSSIARLGLFVHVTADLIDIGYKGCITFQLFSTLPVRIYPGMRIGQVSFWQPLGEISLYEGKYQHADGPRSSKAYMDF